MPDIVIDKLTEQAVRQGCTRSTDTPVEFSHVLEDELNNNLLPETLGIDGRLEKTFDGPDMVDPVGEDTFKATPSAKVQEPGVPSQAQVEGASASSSSTRVSLRSPSTLIKFVEEYDGPNASRPELCQRCYSAVT